MFKIYKVQDGEQLQDIARKFSTSVDQLYQINGYDRNSSFDQGQLLIVPNNNIVFQQYIVKKGDTIYEIAKLFNTDVRTLLLINGLDKGDYIYPNQMLLLPSRGFEVYITKDNDTLTSVASNLKTSKEKIINENGNILLAPDQIIVHKKENIM